MKAHYYIMKFHSFFKQLETHKLESSKKNSSKQIKIRALMSDISNYSKIKIMLSNKKLHILFTTKIFLVLKCVRH